MKSTQHLLDKYNLAKAAVIRDDLLQLAHASKDCDIHIIPDGASEHAAYQRRIQLRLLSFQAFNRIYTNNFTQALVHCSQLYQEAVLKDSLRGQREPMQFLLYILGNIQGFGPQDCSRALLDPESMGCIWLEIASANREGDQSPDMLMSRISGQAVITSLTRCNGSMLAKVMHRFNELFDLSLSAGQTEPCDSENSYLYWGHEKVKAMYRPGFRYSQLLDLATREIRALCQSGDPYLDLEYALRAHQGFTKVIAWRFCSDVEPGQDLQIPIVEL